jgi:hypothetical protein
MCVVGLLYQLSSVRSPCGPVFIWYGTMPIDRASPCLPTTVVTFRAEVPLRLMVIRPFVLVSRTTKRLLIRFYYFRILILNAYTIFDNGMNETPWMSIKRQIMFYGFCSLTKNISVHGKRLWLCWSDHGRLLSQPAERGRIWNANIDFYELVSYRPLWIYLSTILWSGHPEMKILWHIRFSLVTWSMHHIAFPW